MRSINKVIIVGNLTRDPELRQTPNGQSVATFGVATNRDWITRGNEKKSSAEFHECVAWAHLAEICQKYIRKGNLVYIEGYLKTRSWETPEGIKKFKTEIVAQDLIILEKRKNTDAEFIPSEKEEIPAEKSEAAEPEEAFEDEEETAMEEEEDKKETKKSKKDDLIDQDLGL